MLLVEYTVLDDLKVINEGTSKNPRLKVRGIFQKCDEQNNNGRIYPRGILESQVTAIQDKINERALVGALDHPANDAVHLSQASHLITKLWVEKNGQVMGEAEILSTPNGKIVEALIGDGVKIGISSRGLGSVSESHEGKVVNEDFKLITFDLVSDPSTKGAYPELTESIRENSERAQAIISKHRKDRVLLTMLESKIRDRLIKVSEDEDIRRRDQTHGLQGEEAQNTADIAAKKAAAKKAARTGITPEQRAANKAIAKKSAATAGVGPRAVNPAMSDAEAEKVRAEVTKKRLSAEGDRRLSGPKAQAARKARDDSSTSFRDLVVSRIKEAFLSETGEAGRRNKAAKRDWIKNVGRMEADPEPTARQSIAARKAARHEPEFSGAATVSAGREKERQKAVAQTPVGPSNRDKLAAKLAFKKDQRDNPPKPEPGRTQSRAEYSNDRPVVRDR